MSCEVNDGAAYDISQVAECRDRMAQNKAVLLRTNVMNFATAILFAAIYSLAFGMVLLSAAIILQRVAWAGIGSIIEWPVPYSFALSGLLLVIWAMVRSIIFAASLISS